MLRADIGLRNPIGGGCPDIGPRCKRSRTFATYVSAFPRSAAHRACGACGATEAVHLGLSGARAARQHAAPGRGPNPDRRVGAPVPGLRLRASEERRGAHAEEVKPDDEAVGLAADVQDVADSLGVASLRRTGDGAKCYCDILHRSARYP